MKDVKRNMIRQEKVSKFKNMWSNNTKVIFLIVLIDLFF